MKESTTTKPRALHVAIAALAALLAWQLRRTGLGASSLWLDDSWQALVAKVSVEDMHYAEALSPGFAWLLRFWFQLLGFDEATAQAFPFFFGVLLPPLAYFLAIRSGFAVSVAAFVSLVLAAAPMHASFSSRVKPYSAEALLALLLIWPALSWTSRGDEQLPIRKLSALALASVGALYFSTALAPIAFAALLSVALVEYRCSRRVTAAGFAAAFAVVAIGWWKLVLKDRVSGGLLRYWDYGMISGTGPLEWLHSASAALEAMLAGFFVGPPRLWLLLCVLAAIVLAAFRFERLVLLASPVAAAVLLSALGLAPLGGGRTDIYLLVPVVFLLACAAQEIAARSSTRSRQVLHSALVGTAIATVIFSPGSRPYPVEDVRPLIESLEADRSPGELVLVYPVTRFAYALYGSTPFYLKAAPQNFGIDFGDPAIRVLASQRKNPALYRDEIQRQTQGARGVWFLASHLAAEVESIEEALKLEGFFHVELRQREGARLTYWSKGTNRSAGMVPAPRKHAPD